jgi:YtkA-like
MEYCFRAAAENVRSAKAEDFEQRWYCWLRRCCGWDVIERRRLLQQLRFEFEVTPLPARVGTVTATFHLASSSAQPVVGAQLTTEADMTHAGMSPVFGAVEEKEPGHYESTLKLGMAGDWVILLRGTLPTGEKLERQFELRNVRPN